MVPPRTRADPQDYYARLGLSPSASRTEIVAAFRVKARLLHPDVPKTGNAVAFVAVKQAYDVLSNVERRAAYDRGASQAADDDIELDVVVVRRPVRPVQPEPAMAGVLPRPGFFDLSVMLWIGLAVFLGVCVYQAATHLLAPSLAVRDEIRPNAATVEPLSATAHEAVLYGPTPVRLAGVPNFYVAPGATPAILWRLDAEHGTLVSIGKVPPFSSVQAIRLIRQSGMLEVMVNDHANGFISADHLTPGNVAAARRAYCGYNAGPPPSDGELLERRGTGSATLEIENKAIQPVVVKLRDERGAVALAVYLDPGGRTVLEGVADGVYRTEFAIGELWSRACNVFTAGMRARRLDTALTVPRDSHLAVEGGEPAADIPAQAFERN
ncbi:MAG TPA: J domain-containing protein [Rhodopila sp.]